MHRDSSVTLGSLLEEARSLTTDHAITLKMKDEVLAAVRDAHERHHIAFEQKL
jgi:hypothetical protein